MSKSLLDRDTEAALLQAWQGGDLQARDRLIMSLQPLIAYRVKRCHHAGLDPADLMQAGYLGALRALRTFNPALGFRLTTYAVSWIHAYVSHTAARYRHHYLRVMSLNQISRHGGENESGDGNSWSISKDLTVQDALGTTDPDFDRYDSAALVHTITRQWRHYLTKKERTILTRHYLKGHYLSTIGRDLGVSRERIRQLEVKALDRLRLHLEPLARELRA
jgi:RNA polymerase sigma factor (sigma-70 family)